MPRSLQYPNPAGPWWSNCRRSKKNRLHPYLSIRSRMWVQLVTLEMFFLSFRKIFFKKMLQIDHGFYHPRKQTPKKNIQIGIQVTVVPKRHARKMRKESLRFGDGKNCRLATCPLEGPGQRHAQQAAITTLKVSQGIRG